MIIRVLEEKLADFRREFPNLVPLWSLTDEDIIKLIAADQMSLTFASRPASWKVIPRDVCDHSTQSWRAEIDEADILPLGAK